MVQRLSKAYDDVENFENGFTAHYLTLINAVDSELPKLTIGAKNTKRHKGFSFKLWEFKARANKSARGIVIKTLPAE